MRTYDNTLKGLHDKLTDREREILKFTAFGKSQKEIADQLSISVFTVNVHLKHIKLKTHLQKATELTAAWFVKHYNLPLYDLPEQTRARIAAALLALSVFTCVIHTTDMLRVFRTTRVSQRAQTRRNTRGNEHNFEFEYLPLTA